MAAAGIAVMSPAPRGSGGFGAEFAALNDGDLGGDEIVDILYAAKWLVEKKGYRPEQIGVFGGSHGGYATMRSLTFPPETNGRGASFPFGFGWSHAGFSDILTFYETCNIPDWVVKEAGDPTTEADRLRDRSPISHVDRLGAPILLTHGTNDWRVPVTESRRFAARAEELGRRVTFIEFEGQGHGIRGFENQVRFYQAVFSFLESVNE
jgi:dipeptidyl aminopeptidase/acylaminoacyl peptidase